MVKFNITPTPPEKRFEGRLRRGERPSRHDTAALLEELGNSILPEAVRHYIAALLRGEIKGTPGRKRMHVSDTQHRNVAIAADYTRLRDHLQAIRKTKDDAAMRREAGYPETSREPPAQIAAELVAEAYLGDRRQAKTVQNIASSQKPERIR